jgi:hypothetical protein
MVWDPLKGDTLLIALQDGTLYAASAPDFAPRRMADLGGLYGQAVWIK